MFRPACILVTLAASLNAETWYEAWLRYQSMVIHAHLPATVVTLDRSAPALSAQAEVVRGIQGMMGETLRTSSQSVNEDMLVLATAAELQQAFHIQLAVASAPGSYALQSVRCNKHNLLLVAGSDANGILYGAFAFLRKLVLHEDIGTLDEVDSPRIQVRWVNQWDNLDGTIERGYGGRSIFFLNDAVRPDLSRAGDYARLLASVGINGCTVNNVNANPRMLTSEFIPQLARIADAFRPWGIQLSISVDLGSPKTIGGLNTFDPLEPRVAEWWKNKVDEIYRAIPDFGGFTLKADSEGQVGPSAYGRTHADAANVLAVALAPHGGIVVYRGFVYNHHMDWRDPKNDRARAAYDNFHPLDGRFAQNAAVQIKYGPIDFQVREPISPLLAGLPSTNKTLELQITQEYLGQQRHVCYLVPMWKEILGSELVKKNPLFGIVGVANVGLDSTWLGSDLALANLYGFGRLAWNADLPAERITDEWTRMTFGDDAQVVNTVTAIQLQSWRTYEGYTGVLGLQTLTDILHSHYQPNVSAAEHNGWGQWIHADDKGIGMDRTAATGTGYIAQYPPELANRFESLQTTPDNLLLFMHHVPYTYLLHSGDTVIQYIYDSHYNFSAEAQHFPEWWRALRGRVDDQRFNAVLAKLDYQAGDAIVWRDSICKWFLRESGIPDQYGRVGHYPDRVEAESMRLLGYQKIDITPSENASGGQGTTCPSSEETCTAEFTFNGSPGWYTVNVQYFDENTGAAQFRVLVNEQTVDAWTADLWLPSSEPNGDTSVRRSVRKIALRPGDRKRVEGAPQAGDGAALDYIAVEKTSD